MEQFDSSDCLKPLEVSTVEEGVHTAQGNVITSCFHLSVLDVLPTH